MELEEKVRILKEQFSSLPRILIKKTLCSDDINEDLDKCKQRLQEFNKQIIISNPSLRSTLAGTTTGLHDPSQEGCVSTDKAEDLSENALENRNVKALQRKNREQYGDDCQDNDYADNVRNWNDDGENDYDYDYEEDYNDGCDDDDDDFQENGYYDYEEDYNDGCDNDDNDFQENGYYDYEEDYNDGCDNDDDDFQEDGYYDYEEDCEEVCFSIPVVSQPYNKLDNLPPNGWAPMPRDERGNEVVVHTVNLANTCAEYHDVAQRVRQTLPSQNIVSIARIQNPFLYQSYQLRKQKMEKDSGGDNERQLFHGTNPDNVTKINTQGFDRSFSGTANGAFYGTGVYFARDASYSRCYTSNTIGAMYLARVLVGQYCKGDTNMKKPPPINEGRPEILFDSMVNDMQDPSIFVVYYDSQCYPEYLIRF